MAPSVEPNQASAGTRRELIFQDGSSNKFWNVELSGRSYTVTFGRIGTAGQVQTKEFDSDDAARKACDKLIAEKLKKGYVDSGGAGTTPPAAASASAVVPALTAAQPAAKAKSKKGASVASSAEEAAPTPEGHATSSGATPSLAAASQVAAPIADLDIVRSIELGPADWARATFRPRTALDRGEPAPFNLADCCARVAKLRTDNYGWTIRWSDLKLPVAMTSAEAHFWLAAMTAARKRDDAPKDLATKLSGKKFAETPDSAEILTMLQRVERWLPQEVALALVHLVSFDEFLELFLAGDAPGKANYQASEIASSLMNGFTNFVLPYLTDAQVKTARQRLLRNWDATKSPIDFHQSLPKEYYLAAALGLHEQVWEVTSSWADDRYVEADWADHYHRPQDLVFGLGTSELVAAEWRRLKLRMRSGEQVRAFLACTEYSALDCVRDSILAETNKEKCQDLLEAFATVRAPEAALPMLECKLAAKTPAVARQWLDTHVGHAIYGLTGVAGGRGKLADAAIDYLRSAKKLGHADVIVAALQALENADAADKVRREVLDHAEKSYAPFDDSTTPAWLATALAEASALKGAKPPSWAAPQNLPPLPVGEFRLNDAQLLIVLRALAASPVLERHPLLAALRERVDRHARDEFAWKLFQSWLEDGGPAKEKWAMSAIGQLGDDGCALKLTPLVRAWPGESQHQRAVFGLECLRAIGSDAALMQLAGCAQKLKFKGLKAKAEEFVEAIAAARGMSRAELEDRVVPDCGLDEAGRREFNFGPRKFSFVLGADLKANVKDESGKVRGDLPKPSAKDDAALAEQAVADWKLMKGQIKEVAAIQAGRLEQAMVTGRRWKLPDFLTLLVRHPLLTHLTRALVWGAFDDQGRRLATFRVTDERDFADVRDDALELGSAETVGVLHPLEIDESERAAWGEMLSDYEIVGPFPQFGRPIYRLHAGEEATDDLKRFHGLKIVAPTLVFTLEKLGWIRGAAMDAGCFDEHSKQFPAAGVTAIVGYEGTVGMGYIDPNELLTLESVQFVRGMRPPSGYGWDKEQTLRLGDVPAVVMSEVLADLQVLKSKAK